MKFYWIYCFYIMWGRLREKGKIFDNFSLSLKVYDIFRFSKCFCVKLRIYIFSTYQLFHPVLPIYLPELNAVYEIILWHFALILIFILLIVFFVCVFFSIFKGSTIFLCFSPFLKGVLVLYFLVFYLFLVLYFLVLYLFYWFSIKSGYYYYYFGCAVWLMRS